VNEVLLQAGAQKAGDAGLGNTAPLTEEGYQQVADMKNNKEMKKFAHRILNSEARYVTNAAELTGAIHFYSGRMDVQDLATLKAELRKAWWTKAGEGRTAPLTEQGYQSVAKMKSKANMRAFMRRILNAEKKTVSDEEAFFAVAPSYDGEVSTQSFEQLKTELLSAPWAVARSDEQVAPAEEENVQEAVVNEVLLQAGAQKAGDAGLGNTAPLTEEGYQQVADMKNNKEMKKFAHRILNSEARYVTNAAELTGAIHFYSGRKSSQDLATLKAELRSAWWTKAGEGRTAPLTEQGYQAVAKMKSRANMRAFMRRILIANSKTVSDEGAFFALAHHYDGEVSVQTFGQLQNEVLSAPWAVPRRQEENAEVAENVEFDVVDEALEQLE